MRVYQLRHYEVMMRDDAELESHHLATYERLCQNMLTLEAISQSKAIEIGQLRFGRLEQRPSRIARILSERELPAFYFVIGKN